MFQGLSQGATIYVLHKNEPKVEKGRVISANTHMPQYNPAQPQAIFNGMVTDITVSIGNDTSSFAALPANASVANFNDRGLFISDDMNLVVGEITSMRDNSQRVIDSYDAHKNLRDKCDALLVALNPERQKELRTEKEMSELRSQLDELKKMLSAALGTKTKEK